MSSGSQETETGAPIAWSAMWRSEGTRTVTTASAPTRTRYRTLPAA